MILLFIFPATGSDDTFTATRRGIGDACFSLELGELKFVPRRCTSLSRPPPPSEIIPGSHLWGLQESQENGWYRHIEGLGDEQYESVEMEAGDVLIFSAFLVHRSGNNVTDSIRWSCHFRYNDLEEPTFISRKYPNPYTYAPQQELVTKDFPSLEQLQKVFSARPTAALTPSGS